VYIGAILPITLYAIPVVWKGNKGVVNNLLKRLQNNCLHIITGAFQTTNIQAMEKEAVIPPINILIEYKLNMEALRLSHIGNNHPIKTRTLKMPHQNRQPYQEGQHLHTTPS